LKFSAVNKNRIYFLFVVFIFFMAFMFGFYIPCPVRPANISGVPSENFKLNTENARQGSMVSFSDFAYTAQFKVLSLRS